MIAFVSLFLIFFLEATTFLPREKAFFFYSLLGGIYFLEKELRKEKIKNNQLIFIFYLLFLLLAFISFLFSVDKINSINHFIFYLSAFFVFLIGVNEAEFFEKNFKKILVVFSALLCFFSLLPNSLFEATAYQLIIPLYGNHNHLGDFLGLTIIYIIHDLINKKDKKELWLLVFFLLFFLLSFSRSAYLDLLIILFFLLKKPKKFFWLIFLVFIFFIFSQQELYRSWPFSAAYPFITEKLYFQPRSFLSGRPEYFSQAIKGFLEKPVFGWGLGNFIYPSNKYVSEESQQVISALNLPLTVLTETGIFGFLAFIGFWLAIIKKIDFGKKPCYYLFFYLYLNFLTDYTYAIYGMYLLLFLLAGAMIKTEKEKDFYLYPFFAIITLFFIFLKLTGEIFLLSGQPALALRFFLYQHQGYQQLIIQAYGNGEINKAKKIAADYLNQSSFYNFESAVFLSDFYQQIGEDKKALEGLKFYLENNRFPNFDLVKQAYLLAKKLRGKKYADNFFTPIFNNLKTTFRLNQSFEDEVYQFCFEENILVCRFHHFYAPQPNTKEESKDKPVKAVYTFNNEGFNERFNYPQKKQKGVFRILVLGDGNAFGFLVNTKDNWSEKMENLFNQNGKKAEVINASYHSYDLAHAIERYRQQGKKYSPDLIIFMNNNFYRINEIFLPITKKYRYLEKSASERERLRKEEKYFPSWELAWEEYLKKVKDDEVYQKQRQYLDEFFSQIKTPVVFISLYEISEPIKDYLQTKENVKIFELLDFPKNKDYYYKDLPGVISPYGHTQLAQRIYSLLGESSQ
jgi:O-antigen ligase